MTRSQFPRNPLSTRSLNHSRLGRVRHRAILSGVDVSDSILEGLRAPARLRTGTRERSQALTEGSLASRVGKGGFNVVEERGLGLVAFEEVLLFLFIHCFSLILSGIGKWEGRKEHIHPYTYAGADFHQKNQ